MNENSGSLISYADYLDATSKPVAKPVVWVWQQVEDEISRRPHNVQGTVAMSGGDVHDRGTVSPGTSLVVQVLMPGESTKQHRHSFWHLYIVRSGRGQAIFDGGHDVRQLNEGDVLFVPAWCYHAIDNREAEMPLKLLRIQNLPQNASTGNLAREDAGHLRLIYADGAEPVIIERYTQTRGGAQ